MPDSNETDFRVIVPVEGPYTVVVVAHYSKYPAVYGFLAACGLAGVLHLTESHPLDTLLELFNKGIEIKMDRRAITVQGIIHALCKEGDAMLLEY
jgi:hypothetical protein